MFFKRDPDRSYVKTELEYFNSFVQRSINLEKVRLKLMNSSSMWIDEIGIPKQRLDAITPMEKHENRQYSTLISLESAHTSYDLTISNELRAVVTKPVLDNIDQWPGVKRVELVDVSADLPWEKSHGRCPNLKYVKLHLLDSDEEHHKHPVIEFLQSFTGLKRLELWVKTATPYHLLTYLPLCTHIATALKTLVSILFLFWSETHPRTSLRCFQPTTLLFSPIGQT